MSKDKKDILITGSAGFIASHLVDTFIDQGYKVIAVDNFCNFYSPEIKRANARKHYQASNCEVYEIDLLDYESLEGIFRNHNISHIVHLAAMAGVRPSLENPRLYDQVNNHSTINLLDLARKYQVEKFVFASSSSVYGSRSNVPFREDEDISKPISPYAATKVAGEAMVHAMTHACSDMRAVCLRFFTVYGPRQRPDLAIHKFSKLIYEGKPIPVYGDGSFQRDFTYIDDILDGLIKAVDYDKSKFEIFNLGESQTYSVRQLISLLEDKLNKKAQVHYQDKVLGDVPITYADISKARDVLGYNPSTKLEDGLDKFISWFLEQNNSNAILSKEAN